MSTSDLAQGSTETYHTPGPWEIRSRHESSMDHTTVIRSVVIPGHDYIMVSRIVDPTPEQDQVARANVRLLAAAPDLLEALKRMWLASTNFSCMPSDSDVQCAAKAIAKAEGRL